MFMRRRLLVALFLIASLVFIGACTTAKKSAVIPAKTQLKVISVDAYSYKIEIKYPYTGNSGIDKAVDDLIKHQVTRFIRDSGEPKANKDWKYELWIDYTEARFSKSIICFKFEIYEFTGGAHGNTTLITKVLDADGREYGLKDIFLSKSQSLSRLSAISRQSITKKLGAMADEKWIKEGAAPLEKNYGAFIFTPKNMIVYFGQYQVAPYSEGIIEVKVPLSEIKDILSGAFSPR
jgi:hypothetical protein